MKIHLRHILIIITICIIASTGNSCKYDNEETLYPKTDTDTTSADTNVSYSARIQPLFNAKCKNCHDASTVRLFKCATHATATGYLSSTTREQELANRIDHVVVPAINYMPQNEPILPEADRLAIKRWISQGKKNN